MGFAYVGNKGLSVIRLDLYFVCLRAAAALDLLMRSKRCGMILMCRLW